MRDSRAVVTSFVAGGVGAVVAAASWWRLGPVAQRTVWAEDGGVFLRDRVAGGPWVVLEPYAGYLHLLPRIVVDVAWALPVARYALALSIGACLVVGGVSALVFVLSRPVLALPFRVLLALVPAGLPLAPVEIAGNAANLHWYLLFLAPWLYAYRSRTWWGAGSLAAVAVLVGLTEPQVVVVLPLLLFQWCRPRVDLRALPVTLAALVAAGAQVVVALSTSRTETPGPVRWQDVAAGYLLQPVATAGGVDVGDAVRAVLAHGWVVVVTPAATLVVVLAGAVVVGTWHARAVVVGLAVGSVAVWTASIVFNGGVRVTWADPDPALVQVGPLRYAAASGLLLLGAVVTAAGVLVAWGRVRVSGTRRRRGGAAHRPATGRRVGAVPGVVGVGAGCGVSVAVLVAMLTSLGAGPVETRRSAGPEWAPQLPAAAARCRADPASRVVRIETAPWGAAVPCERLR